MTPTTLSPGKALSPLVALALIVPSCALEREPVLDQASVIANTSVRAEPTSSSRTLFRLPEGERVSILGKSGAWYRVLDKDAFGGWMDETTLLLDSTLEQMRIMLAESAGIEVQNTVTTRDAVNLRVAPGRDSSIVRRLGRNLTLEVLDRATTPGPGGEGTDIWLKVRPGPDQIGWVYAPLVQFGVPDALAPFTEGRIYAGVRVLAEVTDPEVGRVHWYVVAERRPGASPEVAFDGIRVFTWNLNQHRYETSLRLGDLRGAYPVEIIGNPPGFRFHVLEAAGNPRPREFAMRGTVPREVPIE
jgi:hypothetical protein